MTPLRRHWGNCLFAQRCLQQKKNKFGAEGKEFSVDEIKAMFLKDLSDIVGMDVRYDKWDTADKLITAGGGGVVDGTVAATSQTILSDHTDPIWIAAQAGFEVKAIVVESSQRDHSVFTIESVFEILKIGACVDMVQACAFDGKRKFVQIPLEKLLTHWSLRKVHIPIQMKSGQQRPVALYVEQQKAAFFVLSWKLTS